MKPLPHALYRVPEGLSLPADRFGVLACAHSARETDFGGCFAVFENGAGIDALRQAIAGGAVGVALGGCRSGSDIQRLAALLSVAEAEEGRIEGSMPILAICDGILPAAVSPEGFAGKTSRLVGLVWDHVALARALGATRVLTEQGEWSGAFAAARAAVLLCAAAGGVPAYDSAYPLVGDLFAENCRRSRDDGFFGRLAQAAEQAPLIESIYA